MLKFIKRIIIVIILVILFAGTILTYKGYQIYKEALNKISVIDKVVEIKKEKNYAELKDLPEFYLDAVIAVEDRRFYSHGAIDPIAITRAVFVNVKSLELKEGGSTITQQLAKNIYFTQEKSALRKVAEMFMAHEIEKNCDKDTILELYLNTSYFGDGYYCVKEACKGYDRVEYKDYSYRVSMINDSEYILLCDVNVDCINTIEEFDTILGEKLQFIIYLT